MKRPPEDRREPPKSQQPDRAWSLEAEVVPGLEDLATAELARLCSGVNTARPGVLRCSYSGPLEKLLRLRLVVAVYIVRYFDLPRPRALLGHQHFTAILGDAQAVLALPGAGEYSTLRISAAGEESAVLGRLRSDLAARSGLRPATDEGDLLLRLRRAGGGWELLTRISPRPLSARGWRVCNMPGALNATVAAAMIALAESRPDEVFLNLACGSGTFLVERFAAGAPRLALGCDISPEAVACAARNLGAARLAGWASLLRADATRLPLPDGFAGVLAADLPFGQLIGSHEENQVLYPALLAEAARVARPGARMALISHEVRLLERTIAANEQWSLVSSRRVTLPFKTGGINPAIYLLHRT